jgi:hypothetical protein
MKIQPRGANPGCCHSPAKLARHREDACLHAVLQDVKPTLEDVDRRRQRREHLHDLIVRPARLDNEPVVEAPLLNLSREGLRTHIAPCIIPRPLQRPRGTSRDPQQALAHQRRSWPRSLDAALRPHSPLHRLQEDRGRRVEPA